MPVAVGTAGAALLLVGFLVLQQLDDDATPTDLAGARQDISSGPQAPATSPTTSSSTSPSASPSPSAVSPAPPRAAAARTVLPVVRAATGPDRTPATARSALEQLMAGRALVTTRLLRATVHGDAVTASAASGVLASTAEDVAAVTRAYSGEPLATEVRELLDAQATAAVDFAEAVRDGDQAAVQRTATALDGAGARLGAALERVTKGAVPALLPREDAGQLRAYVHAQGRGDHAAAYAVERQLQERSAREGAALATTLAGPVDPATATPQQQALAAQWQLLFGEHAVLAGDVVRAGLTGAEDFGAATAALDANTAALTSAVSGVVPPEQAQEFATLWADQIDAVVAYAEATAQGDPAAQEAARTRLAEAGRALTAFFAEATDGRLPPAAVGPALERHSGALVRQADAWAEEDAGAAYGLAAADYAGLAGLAAPAADAFAQTVAARSPVGGAATGLGGLSAVVGQR